MKKAMRRYGSPNEIVTDKLGSYGAAAKELGCPEKQVIKRWANNRVENSHLPFRRRERAIQALPLISHHFPEEFVEFFYRFLS